MLLSPREVVPPSAVELSQCEKPFYSYSELYERCRAEGSVTDVGEFHTMVTYFHALGLLIHLCGADVGHTEESACLVFTDPSHLFENISELYLVQFEVVRGGDKILLKDEGKGMLFESLAFNSTPTTSWISWCNSSLEWRSSHRREAGLSLSRQY